MTRSWLFSNYFPTACQSVSHGLAPKPLSQQGLTCSAADSVHGCRAPPFVFLGVVTLHWAQTMRSIKPSHRIEEAVNYSYAYPYSPSQHRGHQMPRVSFRVVPAWKTHPNTENQWCANKDKGLRKYRALHKYLPPVNRDHISTDCSVTTWTEIDLTGIIFHESSQMQTESKNGKNIADRPPKVSDRVKMGLVKGSTKRSKGNSEWGAKCSTIL